MEERADTAENGLQFAEYRPNEIAKILKHGFISATESEMAQTWCFFETFLVSSYSTMGLWSGLGIGLFSSLGFGRPIAVYRHQFVFRKLHSTDGFWST